MKKLIPRHLFLLLIMHISTFAFTQIKYVNVNIDQSDVSMCYTSAEDEINQYELIRIFPNPGNGIFAIEISNLIPRKDFNIKVCNIFGQAVWQSVWQATESQLSKQIDLSDNPSGFYFLYFHQQGKTFVNKLIIE